MHGHEASRIPHDLFFQISLYILQSAWIEPVLSILLTVIIGWFAVPYIYSIKTKMQKQLFCLVGYSLSALYICVLTLIACIYCYFSQVFPLFLFALYVSLNVLLLLPSTTSILLYIYARFKKFASSNYNRSKVMMIKPRDISFYFLVDLVGIWVTYILRGFWTDHKLPYVFVDNSYKGYKYAHIFLAFFIMALRIFATFFFMGAIDSQIVVTEEPPSLLSKNSKEGVQTV